MGLGDWIMATADAKKVNEKHHVRVQFGDGQNKYWSEVFEGNPRIAKNLEPMERFAWIPNFPGCRPYIDRNRNGRYEFKESFKAEPGELYLPRKEPSGYIMIEPNIKEMYWIGKNKDWGFNNWQALVEKIDDSWMQCGTKDSKRLAPDRFKQTDTLNEALFWLSGAKLLITTDGALHHAAAAMGIPAIVLWGGMASPKNLGYDMHTNIWHGDEPCGTHSKFCQHCMDAMNKITVEEVLEECKRHLAT